MIFRAYHTFEEQDHVGAADFHECAANVRRAIKHYAPAAMDNLRGHERKIANNAGLARRARISNKLLALTKPAIPFLMLHLLNQVARELPDKSDRRHGITIVSINMPSNRH